MAEQHFPAVIITCEHGGNDIPEPWRHLFQGAEDVLQSHRGHDPGALVLAQRFARELQVPLDFSTVSRLLIELNRSPGHPQLFSEFTSDLDLSQRQQLIDQFYDPYRQLVRQHIEQGLAEARRVIHLSVHTFTPVWEGKERPIDVGLLYDPASPGEKSFCDAWLDALRAADPLLRLRRNAPYKGTADGLVTSLRKSHASDQYIGLELEVNQRYPLSETASWLPLQRTLVETFLIAISHWT